LGIGTTSPAAKLDANGGLNSTHAIFSGQAGRGLKISTENTLNNDDGVVYDAQTSTGQHLFKINGSEKARIESDGDTFINGGVNHTTTEGNTNLQVLTTNGQGANLGGSIGLGGVYHATNQITFAEIHGKKQNGTTANLKGYMSFVTRDSGGSAERARITSSGDMGIGTNIPFAKLHVGSRGSAAELSYGSASDGIVFDFYNKAGSPYTRYANIVSSSSDTSESRLGLWTQAASGTSSEKLTILGDGNVGIGQTSPQAGLDLSSSAKGTWSSGSTYHVPSGNAYIKVQGTAAQDNWIGITGGYDQSSGSANLLLQANVRLVNEQAGNYISSEAQSSTSADITFGKMVGGSTTSGNSTKSEFARIDSSGNLLVGKTSSDFGATAGIELNGQYDVGYFTRSAEKALVVNRLSTDGTIADFRKDGTTVGSIGVIHGNNLFIGAPSHSGLQFGGTIIYPTNGSTGDATNGTIDLGGASTRFKDLYLSGAAYTGGQLKGSAGSTTKLILNATSTTTEVHASGTTGIVFKNNGDGETARIDGSGNVGIGTSSPDSLLHLKSTGDTRMTIESPDANDTYINFSGATNEMSLGFDTSDAAMYITNHGTITANRRVTIKTNGNVGIGTSSPDAKLAIDATSQGNFTEAMRISNGGGGANEGNYIQFEASNTSGYGARIGGRREGTGGIGLHFYTGEINAVPTERVRIDHDGNVGIGTTSPTTPLTVNNQTDHSDIAIFHAGGGTPNRGLKISTFSNIDSNAGVELDAQHSSGAFKFSTAGTERLRIDSSGRLGIGTTSPSSLYAGANNLVIGGGAAEAGMTIYSSATTDGNIYFADGTTGSAPYAGYIEYSHSNNYMRLATSGSERLRIDSSGRLGIGTSSPDTTLDVTTGGIAGIILNQDTSNSSASSRLFFKDSTRTNAIVNINGNLEFRTGATIGVSSGTSRLVVNGNGNVGIGTTSPATKFHVTDGGTPPAISTTYLMAATSASNAGIAINAGNASASIIALGDSDSQDIGVIRYDHSDNSMRLHTSSNERMRIDSSGNLLVGTTTTLGGPTDDFMTVANANGGRGGIRIGNTSGSGNTTCMRFHNSNGNVGGIRTSGSATFYDTSSDARLKDVTGKARGLEVINELNPVAYNWKTDGKADEGLIAQEVKGLVPNAVSGSEEEMYQMDYSKLVVHLVAGMKEQQDTITELTARLEALENA